MSQSPALAEVEDQPTATSAAEAQPSPGADHDESELNRGEDGGEQGQVYDFEIKEQDRWLPIANVARIMKGALPENAKIAKEAKECMQECVSEFISFITSEASEKCQMEKRKTVNGEDILFAMTSLGFENYSEALKIYLARYRETLMTRGENQRPATAGGASTAPATMPSPPFEGSNSSNALGGAGEAGESGSDFAYGRTTTGADF